MLQTVPIRRLRQRAILTVVLALGPVGGTAFGAGEVQYLLLATSKTSTMEKELNEGAEAGYRFEGVMGGDTAFGGQEVVAIMSRGAEAPAGRYRYKLLAASRTSTMQREVQDAADLGYVYRGQTVFETLFGGQEVVVILERDAEAERADFQYRLLATNRTSTMQKELQTVGAEGFEFVGMTVGKTAMGGNELVVITRRKRGTPP
ncbi:MAG: hypothetical protein KJ066_12525 [Acidobacteria bacterium]|nr:hypothetical protein [Acidobacteriota bacterium]